MDIQITIDYPKAYTKPWKSELHPELIPDTELLEFVCNENERDLGHLVGKWRETYNVEMAWVERAAASLRYHAQPLRKFRCAFFESSFRSLLDSLQR
jgi:hypothetical protein